MTEESSGRLPEPAVDTIAAVATAPGPGAVALVRLSGARAVDILGALTSGDAATSDHGEAAPARSSRLLRIEEPGTGELLDRALVTIFRGPHSYTGEDMVEISCHGGWLVPSLVLEACLACGARSADPGEFTRRAVLHGKMDLVQAEAVLDLVEGRSRALHGSAVFRLERGLSRRIAELREELIGLEANLVHHIDFPEEDDAPVPLDRVLASASGLRDRLDDLLATAPEGELLREGALTVLAGPPNSGKSSLYNALLGEERAIVTEVPGTTRDALEVVVSLGGFPFRIVDTAGIRETDEVVERLGVEVARRYLERADLVLFCVESHKDIGPGEREFLEGLGDVPVVLLRTKSDLVDGEAEHDPPTPGAREVVSLSVVDGTGLGRLRKLLPSLVYGGLVRTGVSVPALTRRRQTEGVRSARDHVAVFIEDLEGGIPAEMAATHLRPAETALEELLGVISTDEILDRIFHDFCIGK